MDKLIQKKFWSRKRIASGIAIAVLTFVVVYNIGFADRRSRLTIEKDKVVITEVTYAPFIEFVPVSGNVAPVQTFFLDISDGGKVVAKYVQEGASLQPGDPVIKLDNPNLSLQVLSTQSGFLQAESVSRQTRLTFEQNLLGKQDQLLTLNLDLLTQERIFNNNKVLFNKNLIPKNDYDASKDKYETLLKSKALLLEVLKRDSLTFKQLMQQGESNIEMSKNYLSLVKNQLANLTVKAPIKGQLTSLNAEIGQSLPSGYRIGQIDNVDSFKIRAEIDEHYISRVAAGQTAEYEQDGEIYMLTIKTVYPQVTNGRFGVDMFFTSTQPKDIRLGQTVHLKLLLSRQINATLVENGGFYSITGGQWIFALDKSGNTATRRKIKIGRQNPQSLEVLEGLKPGEKVITSSYENYGDYDRLILK